MFKKNNKKIAACFAWAFVVCVLILLLFIFVNWCLLSCFTNYYDLAIRIRSDEGNGSSEVGGWRVTRHTDNKVM